MDTVLEQLKFSKALKLFTTFTRLPEKDSSCSVNVSKTTLVVISLWKKTMTIEKENFKGQNNINIGAFRKLATNAFGNI